MFSFDTFEASNEQVREVLPYAKKRKIELAWVNPGIGLWYLLHLQSPRTPILDNGVVERSLKGMMANFSLDAEYLLGEGTLSTCASSPLKRKQSSMPAPITPFLPKILGEV